MKAALRKYDVAYRVSRFEAATDVGDWFVVVQYPDWTAYNKAIECFANDPEHREVVSELSKVVTLIKREMIVDLDL